MATSRPTSAVINVVYAVHYPLKRSNLSTGAKVGLGVGASLGAILLITLTLVGCLMLFRKRRPQATALAVPTAQQAASSTASSLAVVNEKAASHAAMAPAPNHFQPAPVYTAYPPAATAQLQIHPQAQQLWAYPQPPQSMVYQQPIYAPTAAGSFPSSQIMPPGVYQQAPQISPESTPPAHRVSPVQAPQELHDPHWPGRHEL
jgi:hypothetical protein